MSDMIEKISLSLERLEPIDPNLKRFILEQQKKSREVDVLWDQVCPECGLWTIKFRDGTEMTCPKLMKP